MEENPDSVYRERILQNSQFYIDWALPRVRSYIQYMKWNQPFIKCLPEEYGNPIPSYDYSDSNIFDNEVLNSH